jgi:hypothetical protein
MIEFLPVIDHNGLSETFYRLNFGNLTHDVASLYIYIMLEKGLCV